MNTNLLEPSEHDVTRPASIEEITELRRNTTNLNLAKKCDEFLAAVVAGDEIVEFCTSANSWKVGSGRAAYQIRRSGSVVLELLIRMN